MRDSQAHALLSGPTSTPTRGRRPGRLVGGLAVLVAVLLLAAPASAQDDGSTDADGAGEAAAAAGAAPTDAPPADAPPAVEGERGMPPLTVSWGDFSLTFDGFLRTGLIAVLVNDEDTPDFIGRNNGWVALNARMGLVVDYAGVARVRISFDGAADTRDNNNDPVGEQGFELRDAFGQTTFTPYVQILAGQRRPPFNRESEISVVDQVFVRRSVTSEGLRPGEAILRPGTEGLGVDRQLGIHVLSEIIPLGPVGVRYHAAVTNGNDVPPATRNDNDEYAIFGRVEFHLLNKMLGLGGELEGNDPWLSLGGAVGYNERTQGELPNLLGVDDLSWVADLQVSVMGIEVLGEFLMRERTFPDIEQTDQTSMGILAQAGYWLPWPHFEFLLAYRFAMLDPFVDDDESLLVQDDELTQHTIGVGYRATGMPLQVKLNYTLTMEEGVNEVDNDLFEALFQFVW